MDTLYMCLYQKSHANQDIPQFAYRTAWIISIDNFLQNKRLLCFHVNLLTKVHCESRVAVFVQSNPTLNSSLAPSTSTENVLIQVWTWCMLISSVDMVHLSVSRSLNLFLLRKVSPVLSDF